MRTAEEMGRMAAHLSENDEKLLRDSVFQREEEEYKGEKAILEMRLNDFHKEAKDLEDEKALRGDIPEGMAHENLMRSYYMGFFLLLSLCGEWVFWTRTFDPLGFGKIQTFLWAATIITLSLGVMNAYLNSLRKRFPALQDSLFLILNSVGFILFLLIIFYGADIREKLFIVNQIQNLSSSPEHTLKAAEEFFREARRSFPILLISITTALTIVSGITYHDLMNRFFSSRSFRRLYKRQRKIKKEIINLIQAIADLDVQLSRFKAEFDLSYLKEKMSFSRTGGDNLSDFPWFKRSHERNHDFWKIVGLTVFLMFLAFAIFFGLKGTAKGETLVFLDLSQSMGVSEYTGKNTEFQKNVSGVEFHIQNNIPPGEFVKVLGITERSFSSPHILIEGKITSNRGAFGENIARDKLNLLNQWRKLELKPMAESTDIFGAMQLASILFIPQSKDKKLIIFSDMRHFSKALDLESPNIINVDTMFNEVLRKSLIPSLDGVRVWCLGVHSSGKTPTYWKSLKDFWVKYFRKANVLELKSFTIERRVQNE